MNLFLKATIVLLFTSFSFAQNITPSKADLKRLRELGVSPNQLKKLKNSKSVQNMGTTDEYEFDRSNEKNSTIITPKIQSELKENYQKDISLNNQDNNISAENIYQSKIEKTKTKQIKIKFLRLIVKLKSIMDTVFFLKMQNYFKTLSMIL